MSGPRLDAVRLMYGVAECSHTVSHVVCFGASPKHGRRCSSFLQNPAADRTCRLPERRQRPRLSLRLAAGLQLPAAQQMIYSRIKDSTTVEHICRYRFIHEHEKCLSCELSAVVFTGCSCMVCHDMIQGVVSSVGDARQFWF